METQTPIRCRSSNPSSITLVSAILALIAATEVSLCAQDVATQTAIETGAGASSTRAERGPRVVFTEVEMAHFRAVAEEKEARRESYIRAATEDEIILLEPYIVEGDTSLDLARLRKELKERYRPKSRFELSPGDRVAMLLARRVDDEFFGYGGPNAVLNSVNRGENSMLYVNPIALIAAFRERNFFRNLFSAPPG